MEDKEKEKGKCGGCGREERRLLLHNVVRQRGAPHRRLCTECVLKTHLGHFCAFCYHVYDDSDTHTHQDDDDDDDGDSSHHHHHHHHQDEEKVMCLKCPCVSHPSCVPLSHPHSPPSFLCPSCSHHHHHHNNNPFSFFRTKTLTPQHQPPPSHHRALDQDSARALVAAAKIAAASMSKAAAFARLEAERRVKEAALAKKRAREALDNLAHLAASSHNNAAIGSKRPRETAAASLLQSRNGNGNGNGAPPTNAASVDDK